MKLRYMVEYALRDRTGSPNTILSVVSRVV